MVGHRGLTVCRLFDDFSFFFSDLQTAVLERMKKKRGYTDWYRLQNAPLTNLRELYVQ